MKRITLILFAILSVTAICTEAKNKCVPKMHIFGVSMSFKDSTIYITDLQQIDNVWVDRKNNFVVNRRDYSEQLRQYMVESGNEKPMCVVMMSVNKKKLEKKYQKLQKRYSNPKRHYNTTVINKESFTFHKTETDLENEELKKATQTKRNKQKKNKKD